MGLSTAMKSAGRLLQDYYFRGPLARLPRSYTAGDYRTTEDWKTDGGFKDGRQPIVIPHAFLILVLPIGAS